ncbi:MAG: pathoproteinis-related transcriptional factor and ERF protein [Alphaproteobacteria bacterium]|nr:MAG: pathoproteinis-related transcriptional factor and ERF protein [Caulobacteraceae bacterium]TPW06632.1 MAG: pathoproteinis-related transcriptional factor and ERF protein [Alphaproteobacteria bacterium]
MTSKRRNLHICRVEDHGRGGDYWIVRLIRRGKTTSRMFSDSVHGGKRKSLVAARAWRDETLDPVACDAREAHRRIVVRRNTKSGVPGVARYAPKTGRHPYWTAFWDEPGAGRRAKKFSTRIHGERGARALAVEARQEALVRLGVTDGVAAAPWSAP